MFSLENIENLILKFHPGSVKNIIFAMAQDFSSLINVQENSEQTITRVSRNATLVQSKARPCVEIFLLIFFVSGRRGHEAKCAPNPGRRLSLVKFPLVRNFSLSVSATFLEQSVSTFIDKVPPSILA